MSHIEYIRIASGTSLIETWLQRTRDVLVHRKLVDHDIQITVDSRCLYDALMQLVAKISCTAKPRELTLSHLCIKLRLLCTKM